MKLMEVIAKNPGSLGWKFSLFPAYVGFLMTLVFLFYPSQEGCRTSGLLPGYLQDMMMMCEHRYWFVGGAFGLAVGYTVLLNLFARLLDSANIK